RVLCVRLAPNLPGSARVVRFGDVTARIPADQIFRDLPLFGGLRCPVQGQKGLSNDFSHVVLLETRYCPVASVTIWTISVTELKSLVSRFLVSPKAMPLAVSP